MQSRLALALVLVAACGRRTAAPTTVDNHDDAKADDAKAIQAFQEVATKAAYQRAAAVRSWGTAELDEQRGPDRFAVIEEEPNDTTRYMHYLVEADGHRYLVTMELDGETTPWRLDDGVSPPPWQETDDSRITHQQASSVGYVRVEIAIRGQQVVVLRDEELHDVREDATRVAHDYAGQDDACASGCPALMSLRDTVAIVVTGPVESAGDLMIGINELTW